MLPQSLGAAPTSSQTAGSLSQALCILPAFLQFVSTLCPPHGTRLQQGNTQDNMQMGALTDASKFTLAPKLCTPSWGLTRWPTAQSCGKPRAPPDSCFPPPPVSALPVHWGLQA